MSEARSTTYQRNERGAWVPADKPDSLAEEMTNPGERIACGVRSWTVWETSIYQRDTGDELVFDVGEHQRTRLRLELDTSRRRFHTIREEGVAPIPGGLTLDLYAITKLDEEVGGHVRHWAPSRHNEDRNDLLGTIMVRPAMMDRLVAALRADERVSIVIELRVYKQGIAQSFDEDWMPQDFYVDWEAKLPVDHFAVHISEERAVAAPADSDEEVDARSDVVPTTPAAPVSDPRLVQRLNWIAGILVVIALLLLLRRG
jgi:hypothetical protein